MSLITLHCLPIISLQPTPTNHYPFVQPKGIDLWLCQRNTITPQQTAQLYEYLHTSEKQKAQQYHFQNQQQQYIITHGMLRHLLANYLQQTPQQIHFTHNDRQKPTLTQYPTWQFSISHNQHITAIAIAQNTTIGIDIEQQNLPNIDWKIISQAYFPLNEQHLLEQHPQPNQLFALLWTRKEAILKATGAGLNEDIKHLKTTDGIHHLQAPFNSPYHQTQQTLYIQTLQDQQHYISIAMSNKQTIKQLLYTPTIVQTPSV